MDNKLLRYGAKEYLMKAVICYMNYDTVKGHNTLEKFEHDFPMFADSRECALLRVSSSSCPIRITCLLKFYQ